MLTVFFICLTLLISAPATGFFVLKTFEIKQAKELEQEKLRLEAENIKKHHLLLREKLIRFNRFLQEVSVDFALLFPTIDCSAKISYNDFCKKYRSLWNKISEIQLIADFYVPSIQKSTQELDKLAIDYWQYLYKALIVEEGDRTSPDYLKAQRYSQLIPSKIDDIRQKIKEMVY